MTISEKLKTIAQNMEAVYSAGANNPDRVVEFDESEQSDKLSIIKQNVYKIFKKGQESAETEGLVYTLINDDTEYSVTGYTGAATDIVIPSVYEGKPVTNIGAGAIKGKHKITSVKIPSSVTSIGDLAFAECTSLIEFIISENNSVYKSINGDIYSKDGKTLVQYAGSKTEFIIEDGVTTIGFGAAYGCTKITKVTLPDSVTVIEGDGFYYCQKLESINIPDNVESIGNRAFYYDSVLETIDIGENSKLTTLGHSVFGICRKLTGVNLPNGITTIPSQTFTGCYSITNINLPEHITTIGDRAFRNCTSLAEITIPESVTRIDYRAFENTPIKTIVSPTAVSRLDAVMFEGCTELQTIYCEAESQPSGWSSRWKENCDAEVVWGYEGSAN